ncbi:MAG: SHOCT domain-containing protein [Ilumatobacteraceae bacterium]|jgi:type II secretory pathway component PulF
MLAYDYPILGLFWTMLILFLLVAWILLVFQVIVDVFRSDMGGFSKALWAIFVIVVPWLGVLIYIIANGDKMTARNIAAAQQQQAQLDAYIRTTAAAGGTADELTKLAALRDQGVITAAEFENQKSKLLT